jgi:hypothetical protein
LAAKPRIKANIDDWTVTDVYGTYRDLGASSSTSNAALLDAVQSVQNQGQGGGNVSGNLSAAASQVQAKSPVLSRFNPEMLEYLHEIKAKEAETYLSRGTVTVEELDTVEGQKQQKEQEQDRENNPDQ